MANYKGVYRKTNIKKDGSVNLYIRITHQRKQAFIPTNLNVSAKEFDNVKGLMGGRNGKFVNTRITGLIHEYQRKELELGDDIDWISVKELKEYILNGKGDISEIDFFEFIEIIIGKVKVKGTADQYKSLAASLESYCGRDDLRVSEIKLGFLHRYEEYLRRRGVQNGIINYMGTFRSLFNKCRDYYNDEDTGKILIPHYPFRKYKIPTRDPQARNHVLSVDELKMFMRYEPKNAGEEFAKDIFMLMFYLIGIESKDLFYLQKAKDGRLAYDRYKTGKAYSIKLEPEALAIINKYKGEQLLLNISSRFRHNKSFYRKVNSYLHGDESHDIKGIFSSLGIKKQVTTKWSRHTWATIARNDCRINKDDVALCLGHEDTDNQVTDMYVKYDYSIIDESNRKVLDFVADLGGNDS